MNYTRGREELVVEAVGWLGTAHLKIGNTAKASKLLLSIPEDYPDQIGMSLRAYGSLIQHSSDSRDAEAAEQYLTSLENYANTLVASGASESYPRLNQRMAQLMTMGGDKAGAARWRAAR